MSAPAWYYIDGGQQQGPVTAETLRHLLATSKVPPTALVWAPNMPGWVEARTIPGLTARSSSPDLQPPPPPALLVAREARSSPPPPLPARRTERPPHRFGRRWWLIPIGLTIVTAAAIFIYCIAMIAVPMQNHDSRNAECPTCNERFKIPHHRGDVARYNNSYRCPNCGLSYPAAYLYRK